MNPYKIADTICRLCKEQGLTVADLAVKIDKSERQINRYRNGQCKSIPYDVLNAITEALSTTVDELIR